MAEKMSTALCNQLLDSFNLRDIFAGSFINIYAGTVPATADMASGVGVGATLLCTVSASSIPGAGLNFDPAGAVAGVLPKSPSEVWSGVNGATGIATFYRLVAAGDTDVMSTSEPRIQGTIGTGGADMNVGTTNLTSGATFTLNYFTQAFVPS